MLPRRNKTFAADELTERCSAGLDSAFQQGKRARLSTELLTQIGMYAQPFRDFAELRISGPQQRGRIDKDGGYQVCIGEADAPVVQTPSLNC